ncbi:MAG: twitching motility protein PilT [Calditrichaeota bacterium]|nr:MAG: twitching motility protein PilT [Calditrichota bacterium]
MVDQRVLNAKRLLGRLAGQVPVQEEGFGKLQKMAEVIDQQPEELRYTLRQALDFFLISMESHEASDMDLGGVGTNGQVWFRVYGHKKPFPELGSFTVDEADLLLLNLIAPGQRQELWENHQLHFSHQIMSPAGPMRFRATLYLEMNHLALSLRRINVEIRPFKSLGLHKNVARLMSLEYQKRGLILITGISGSGKSSTLDTIIDANNRTSYGHIVVIADPLEHLHVSKKSVIRQREVGRDVKSFRDGVIQALRQDPDIIVIAEMRDAETFSAVLEAADSGHKVFATLHTSSAVESIDRILGETPPLEQQRVRERLASLLACVISQKLVPTLDGKLVLAKEVMVTNGAVRSAIRNNHTDEIYHVIQQSNHEGMVTMEQDLARLVRSNVISFAEALNHANNKKRLEDLVQYQTNLT